MQAVRPERLVHPNLFLLLRPEVVECKRVFQALRQFGRRQRADLFRGDKQADCRTHLYVPLLQAVVERVTQEGAFRFDEHHRCLQLLQQHAHAGGQRRRAAVEGIAGLRIEQHVVAEVVQRVGHLGDEPQIRHKFIRRDAADAPQKALFSHKAVGGADDVERMGIEDAGRDLQIDKAGMVHHDEAGLVRHAVDPLERIGKLRVLQVTRACGLHHPAPEQRRPHGLLPGRLRDAPDFLQRFCSNFDLHNGPFHIDTHMFIIR